MVGFEETFDTIDGFAADLDLQKTGDHAEEFCAEENDTSEDKLMVLIKPMAALESVIVEPMKASP